MLTVAALGRRLGIQAAREASALLRIPADKGNSRIVISLTEVDQLRTLTAIGSWVEVSMPGPREWPLRNVEGRLKTG